jgi:hypothetical protein
VTSRESFEVATRFFHGDLYAKLYLLEARVKRGLDRIGKSEIFFGVSIKPRRVDFELFHQSADAENTYGPFHTEDLTDDLQKEGAFDWAGPDRLVWEGWFDSSRVSPVDPDAARPANQKDIVVRFDFYVGERDVFGVGFSDNVVFRKQYYVRAVAPPGKNVTSAIDDISMFLYRDENFQETAGADELVFENGAWTFKVVGTGFEARLGISLQKVE